MYEMYEVKFKIKKLNIIIALIGTSEAVCNQ